MKDQPWFPQPRKYYFPRQISHFPGQSIQDLKVINQDISKNDIIFIHCMIHY